MERKGLELSVGLFLLIGLLCLTYVSVKLGHVGIWGDRSYSVYARFPTIAGLKERAGVMMAGVKIGQVEKIQLKDGQAQLTLGIDKEVQLEDDVIAGIKTMGIIGDKYVSISPGASDQFIKPGGSITETQPPLDIENLIGKFVFGNINSPKDDGSKEGAPKDEGLKDDVSKDEGPKESGLRENGTVVGGSKDSGSKEGGSPKSSSSKGGSKEGDSKKDSPKKGGSKEDGSKKSGSKK